MPNTKHLYCGIPVKNLTLNLATLVAAGREMLGVDPTYKASQNRLKRMVESDRHTRKRVLGGFSSLFVSIFYD